MKKRKTLKLMNKNNTENENNKAENINNFVITRTEEDFPKEELALLSLA